MVILKITIECMECGSSAQKEAGEVNRSIRLGRNIFCSLECAGTNSNRAKKCPEIKVKCPVCGIMFVTSTKKRAKRFCSGSCASKGSMTEGRRNAQRKSGYENLRNLISPAEALKRREAWKYVALKESLSGERHEFEYEIGSFVFDLVLFDRGIVVEFDGNYHSGKQLTIDAEKDKIAAENGFSVVRVKTRGVSVIDPVVIENL